MPERATRLSALLERHQGGPRDPHYAAFFDCFNHGQFFEAHEVLEVLWLQQRRGVEGDFYKALIQVAGAFVHLQKQRPGPAGSLLRLAAAYLAHYPSPHCGLNTLALRARLEHWREEIEARGTSPLDTRSPPEIRLDL